MKKEDLNRFTYNYILENFEQVKLDIFNTSTYIVAKSLNMPYQKLSTIVNFLKVADFNSARYKSKSKSILSDILEESTSK